MAKKGGDANCTADGPKVQGFVTLCNLKWATDVQKMAMVRGTLKNGLATTIVSEADIIIPTIMHATGPITGITDGVDVAILGYTGAGMTKGTTAMTTCIVKTTIRAVAAVEKMKTITAMAIAATIIVVITAVTITATEIVMI